MLRKHVTLSCPEVPHLILKPQPAGRNKRSKLRRSISTTLAEAALCEAALRFISPVLIGFDEAIATAVLGLWLMPHPRA
jgi:hypothetical protein